MNSNIAVQMFENLDAFKNLMKLDIKFQLRWTIQITRIMKLESFCLWY